MQLCSRPRGAHGIEPKIFRLTKGSAVITFSDHWTDVSWLPVNCLDSLDKPS